MPLPYGEDGFGDLFNTELTPEEEQAFLKWQKENPRLGNTYDYDARGFWKAGADTAANGHGADTFKKPNHPTFSDQSKYSGVEGMVGGKWIEEPGGGYTFVTSPVNEMYHAPEDLQRYFDENEEPNVKLSYTKVRR